MIFSIDWFVQNPVQTIDSGVRVIFDSEPILLSITIVTFLIVAFFVWNKNKMKLYKMAKDRKPMKVEIDMEGLKNELAQAKVADPPQGTDGATPVTSGTPVGTQPPIGQPRPEMDGVSDTDDVEDEILNMIEQHPDLLKKALERTNIRKETDNQQHTYEEAKKETPRERMKRLWKEGKMGRKKDEKAGQELPKKPGKEV